MAESVPPASVPPTAALIPPSPPVSPVPPNAAQIEYDRMISYFKWIVGITGTFIAIIVAVATGMLYSSIRDVRVDAKDEATRVATAEAKARVAEAFDQKNINAMILEAAQEKIGPETDKMIQQQLATRLGPIQEKITVIGQISESEIRMRMGFRGGLDDLTRLMKRTKDTDVLKFANTTMIAVSQDYDTRMQENVVRFGGQALFALQNTPALLAYLNGQRANNVHDVVQIIQENSDLNAVATGFIAFRQLTGENVKMFDLAAITSWCSRNKPRCEVPEKPAPSPAPKQ